MARFVSFYCVPSAKYMPEKEKIIFVFCCKKRSKLEEFVLRQIYSAIVQVDAINIIPRQGK